MGDITYEQKPVFTSDELSEALTEMDNLAREGQKVQPHELAERVIQEMGK